MNKKDGDCENYRRDCGKRDDKPERPTRRLFHWWSLLGSPSSITDVLAFSPPSAIQIYNKRRNYGNDSACKYAER